MKNISNIDDINATAISFIRGFQDPKEKKNLSQGKKNEKNTFMMATRIDKEIYLTNLKLF